VKLNPHADAFSTPERKQMRAKLIDMVKVFISLKLCCWKRKECGKMVDKKDSLFSMYLLYFEEIER